MQRTGEKAFMIALLLVVIPAFALSTTALIADVYTIVADRIIDDASTEERDVIDISEQSLPTYLKAVETLEIAKILAPLNSDHARTLTNMYTRINEWKESMQAMDVAPPEDLPPGNQLRNKALFYAKDAVTLDPANADHHLALGQRYAADRMREAALEEFIKAINAYPVNGAIRYAVAMQMLMMGLQEQAREQACLLAALDDSYRLDDDNPAANMIRERRPPGYEASLTNSYLYKSMEITWRTSAKDPKAVLEVVPDNIDAREVERIFFEQKGINVDNDRNE